MQPVEDFVNEYFRARSEVRRAIRQLYVPFDSRFLAPALTQPRDDHQSEAERILTVEGTDSEAQATTTGYFGPPLRYGVSAASGAWQITRIEAKCPACHGTGKTKDGKGNCGHCQSTGWLRLRAKTA
jgi:hypothetical protein